MDWKLFYYIIPALTGIAGLTTITVLYVKKFPKVKALDLDAMIKHRQAQRKTSLAEERLMRKLASAKQTFYKMLRPVGQAITVGLRALFAAIKKTEERYRQAAKGGTKHESAQQTIGTTLQAAETLYNDGKYAEAEKTYISAIAIDSTSIDAYRGLAKVYTALKDRPHAIETLTFLRQLNPKDEAVWQEVGRLYKEEGMLDDALEAYEAAFELAPNNPKVLDALIEAAIANKFKFKAQVALDKLREVNPDNKKIEEYEEQILEL